jgi:hypothetical protein
MPLPLGFLTMGTTFEATKDALQSWDKGWLAMGEHRDVLQQLKQVSSIYQA